MGAADFTDVEARLRAILRGLAPPLVVAAEGPGGFTLNVNRPDIPEPQRYFGGVRRGKRYVSVYLMPVYVFPELLEGISPALKKRMQGKSCFNFTRVDDTLFKELEALAARSLERYREMRRPGIPV